MGVVISESAAEKLKSYKVEETYISLNKNDIFINLYGEESIYKSFPYIGEMVKNRILCSRRRIEYKKALYDLRNEELNKIDHVNDDVMFTSNGMIVDVNIYSNTRPEDMKGNLFNDELKVLMEEEKNYYQRLYEVLSKIVLPRENNYTDELGYVYEYARQYMTDDIKWKYDGKVYEHILIKFTILKEQDVSVGHKITGRYGNKGIISAIVPDEEMPTTESGKVADICLNPLGVIGRLNLSQLYEQYINHMSDRLLDHIQDMSVADQIDEVIDYVSRLNKTQGEFIMTRTITMNRAEQEEFMDELYRDGIYIHQPPFFGNSSFEDFVELYKDKPYICEKYKFKGMEKPLILGDLYFVLLKHTGENKFSARSTSMTNIRNIPSKSTAKKNNKALFSETPIRIGEMEVTNLMITKRSDIVEKLLKTYSTSEEDRVKLVEDILVSDNPLKINSELNGDSSINRKVLNSHLNVLGLKLEE
jgi:DNA-directed RNA polymerase beta subunit